MTQGQDRPVVKRTGGVVLMLLGAGMMGWGAHYLTINGSCSGTGYLNNIGPVHTCSGGEFFYITATFFAGPFVALVGWAFAKITSLLWPLVCVCLGAGLITLHWVRQEASGAGGFGLIAGACFFGLALLSVATTIKNRIRKPVASPSPVIPRPPGLAAFGGPSAGTTFGDAVPPVAAAAAAQQPAAGTADPLDRIARLAQLRDSGALTEAEFQREKDKILGQS